MLPPLHSYIKSAEKGFNDIEPKRVQLLHSIAQFITQKLAKKELAKLIFICTHNSRRSHFGHIWAQTAAHYYAINNIECFSGGTEATAFNTSAIKALKNAGFNISEDGQNTNTKYVLNFDEKATSITCFSKVYTHPENPQTGFLALMTCNEADEACPLIFGAEARFALNYQDPKSADGTAFETEVYAERCLQIATEMLYLFSLINKKHGKY